MKLRFACAMLSIAGLAALPTMTLAVPGSPPVQPHINPLAGQQKQVHDADAAVVVAKKQLQVIRKRIEGTFEAKPDFKAAKDALEKSKGDYDAQTRRSAAQMAKDPAYLALVTKRDKAQEVIDLSHKPAPVGSGDDPVKLTDQDIQTAVKDHEDAVLAIRAMQKQSQESDPKLPALMQKRQEAQANWDALQVQVDEAMKADPQYPQAQQAVDAAEQTAKQAREALANGAKAQRDAEAAANKARAAQGAR